MERLFTMLKIGDAVQIRGERDEQVARVFGGEKEDTMVVTVAEAAAQSIQQPETNQSAIGLGN
jgi:hypothetical protein